MTKLLTYEISWDILYIHEGRKKTNEADTQS